MVKKLRQFDREQFFRALADDTRLRLINLIGDDEVCVCFFVEILDTNQPKISRHLAYLRKAGIVSSRRQGTWMHYRLEDPPDAGAAKVLADVRNWLLADLNMQRDRQKLAKICCGPQMPVQLTGAPRPASLVVGLEKAGGTTTKYR